MTEEAAAPTAGSLLRAAREKQGLHIAALAAAIKVAPRKLDALEHDRYDELPDATFTRALAQTVCRTLKVDPQPVLALLPQPDAAALDTVNGGLNAPFRERPGRDDAAGLAVGAVRPMVWGGLVLLLAAAAVYVVPAGSWQRWLSPPSLPVTASNAPAPAAAASSVVETVVAAAPAAPVVAPVVEAASAPGAAAPAVVAAVAPAVETVHGAPPPDPSASAEAPRLVQLRTNDASWVEARDVRGQVLFSRIVQPGEAVGFDGALPIRLTIGNAPATQLSFRGKPVALAASTRENVARIELQ